MLFKIFIIYFVSMSFCFSNVNPLSKKNFIFDRDGFERGTYLIVLSNPDLYTIYMTNFVNLKKTQGFDVEVVSFREGDSDLDIYGINGSVSMDLKNYLIDYYSADPMLEYVLLVGDVNQNNDSYNIPTFEIPSYNENENDQTDYPYTFFDTGNGEDVLSPHFFLGRWSIGSTTDLANIIKRNIQYATLNESFIPDPSYLNNALVVAGNYSGEGTSPSNWPVTPVWTSKWLQEELYFFGYSQVDSAFFHKYNYDWATSPDQIEASWNAGVGVINYRGWGDARGWHKPQFRLDEIQDLLNPSFSLPVVFSFVCNTGDFGNEQQVFCFGETLLTAGTITAPKGAVAVIGPSDLDTDTRFNNVLCGSIWDEFLEGRVSELAPGLHKGKQAVTKEFSGLVINGTDIPEFYHHVYGVLGDPSLSVWIKEPTRMTAIFEEGENLSNNYVFATVTDNDTGEPIKDVVGALIYEDELIGKGISDSNGIIYIEDFENEVSVGNILTFYINKGQYYQESYELNIIAQNDNSAAVPPSNDEEEDEDYGYEFEIVNYDWIEISETGTNLNLADDTNTTIPLNFDFMYYGESFSELTVCSNGWASFLRCLDGNTNDGQACDALSYFYNNSITAAIGPYGMLAPFYDDLDDNNGTEPLNIYSQWIEDESKFVIQWNNIANGHVDEYCESNSVGDVNEDFIVNVQDMVMIVSIILDNYDPSDAQLDSADCNNDGNIDVFDILYALSLSFDSVEDPEECVHETFQLILIPGNNSDGEIIFQYKDIYNVDDHGATIGIESPDKNQGVEYLFNQSYNEINIKLRFTIIIK